MDAGFESRLRLLEAEVVELGARLRNAEMAHSPADERLEERALRLLSLLRPKRPVAMRFARIGSAFDGGYVLPDDVPISVVTSYGVGTNCDFEEAMVHRGARVEAFDHTIETYPAPTSKVTWYREALGAVDAPGCVTIESSIPDVREAALVKIDVEGHEWFAIDATSVAVLQRASCLVVEFHDLDRLMIDSHWALIERVLEKLNEVYSLVHIHANNAGPTFRVAGRAIPSIVECTYLNWDLVGDTESAAGAWPTPLDAPNLSAFPDIELTSLWE